MIHFIDVFAFWYYAKYLARINWYFIFREYVIVVQWLSCVWLFVTPWTTARQLPCPSPSPSRSLLKFMSIELVMPSNHLILCPQFASCHQSFPASGSFPMSQLFVSGGQSIGASASVLPMNIQDWFPLGLAGFITLLSRGLSRVFSSTKFKRIIG